MSSKKIKIFLHLLGPAVFIYILTQIDFGFLREKLLEVNIYFLISAVIFVMVQIVLRGLKWRTALMGLRINLGKSSAVSLYWLGTFIGAATPGRLGELAK
ncbi:flippase-like domain-containing protein, partial [Patescibacteria group bacterium]|nr:flippase-like domain-containing protein [Patescibacteria group bacterium]